MRLFAGGLSQDTKEDDLKQAFEKFGEVESVKIIIDHNTNRSKGYGFIDMPDTEQAKAAIEGLNGSDLKGAKITVNEARPRNERRGHQQGGRGQGRGGNRGGSYGGGGYQGEKKGFGGNRPPRSGNR